MKKILYTWQRNFDIIDHKLTINFCEVTLDANESDADIQKVVDIINDYNYENLHVDVEVYDDREGKIIEWYRPVGNIGPDHVSPYDNLKTEKDLENYHDTQRKLNKGEW